MFTPSYALLLGRRTYDIFTPYWPYAEGDLAKWARRWQRPASMS